MAKKQTAKKAAKKPTSKPTSKPAAKKPAAKKPAAKKPAAKKAAAKKPAAKKPAAKKPAAKKAAAKKAMALASFAAPAPTPAAMGALGADSSDLVTSVHGGDTLLNKARTLFGGKEAVFWGRYFKEAGNTDPTQYQPQTENAALHARGIRVLALGRQTNVVGGTAARGRQEARRYVGALFWAFGVQHLATSGGVFYLFLDVEPATPMSSAFYTGWAAEVESYSLAQSNNTVRILPCVYLNQGDTTTLQSLRTAMAAGAKCLGLWTAHYYGFDASGCRIAGPWDPSMAVPAHSPAPVLAWQYIGDCWEHLDASQVNPAIDLQNDLLRFLIPPPAGMP